LSRVRLRAHGLGASFSLIPIAPARAKALPISMPTLTTAPLEASQTMAPARSALLVGNFLSGVTGVRGVCEDLAVRLAQAGWTLATTSPRPAKLARLADMLETAWRLRHEYSVAQVDVYSGPAFFWAEAVCWTLRRARKPYVLTLHGGNLPAFAKRWPRRVRRLLGSAAVVTTPSRYLLEQMSAYRGGLCLLPNPLDISAYAYHVRTQPRPQLVWLRAFHHIYNAPLAPRVLAELAGEFPDIKLVMVGPDKGDGSLAATRRKAEELGVAGRVSYSGPVPKAAVPDWLTHGDIFLNTTNVDNTPVSVLEAMATGLCVVSTNVGGLPYLLEDGHNALLVPPDDPSAMASAVRRLLVEPGLAERISRNGRETARAHDWSVILPRWEELLGRLAPGAAQTS
jgi:L-malate glycosyltransferase